VAFERLRSRGRRERQEKGKEHGPQTLIPLRYADLRLLPLVPAKAGTQSHARLKFLSWIPAFAGMSGG
jgi:hypothetical protein